MDPSERKLQPAFNKAADALAAWRQQQIAALTDTQRHIYEEARCKADEKRKAKEKELAERKQTEIKDKLRKKLAEKHQLQFDLSGKRVRNPEIFSERVISDYVESGKAPNISLIQSALSQATQAVTHEVSLEHARELKAFEHGEQAKLDKMLRLFERGRERQAENRKSFLRAKVKDKAKEEFNRGARKDDNGRDR